MIRVMKIYLGKSPVFLIIFMALFFQRCSTRNEEGVSYNWETFCINCHGGLYDSTGAPPPDTKGDTAVAVMAVGAHTSHVKNKGIACDQCHPGYEAESSLRDPRHLDGPPAEVVWGPESLARTGGTTPVWNREEGTCSAVYCHGATLAGGTNKTPVWNRVGQGQAACGSCHEPGWKQPPEISDAARLAGLRVHILHEVDPRGPRLTCSDCHPPETGESHVNGRLELNDGARDLAGTKICDNCHGNAVAAAKQFWGQPRDQWMKQDEVSYCLNCHSSQSPPVAGRTAPPVSKNYGTSGHGTTSPFPATLHGNPGPGLACTVCHDPDSPHLEAGGEKSHRLRIDNSNSDLCLDCHGPDSPNTLGYPASSKATIHSHLVTDRYNDVPEYDYQCAACHDPHGTSNLAMIKETINGGFGVDVAVSFTGDDLSGLDPTDSPDDGVCDACHKPDEAAHSRTNHPNNHNYGAKCVSCHKHDRGFWF